MSGRTQNRPPLILSRFPTIILCLLSSSIFSQDECKSPVLSKPSAYHSVQFNINRINNWLANDGFIVSHRTTGHSGCEWPKGSGLYDYYTAGICLVGQVQGNIRSAAAEYSSEWSPGRAIYTPGSNSPGISVDPHDTRYRMYTVKPGDSADPTDPDYNVDYAQWPVGDGAPAQDGELFDDVNDNGLHDPFESFEDYNLNGIYDPPDGQIVEGEDPPLFNGDRYHWFVMNDLGEERHANLWNTEPLGIELQAGYYGFADDGPLGDVMFMEFLVVNKGGMPIDSVFFGIWNDPDVGDSRDDYSGCDRELDLAYAYNADNDDEDYGVRPPAAGISLFQGPLVDSPGDTAKVHGQLLPGMQMMKMYAYTHYT